MAKNKNRKPGYRPTTSSTRPPGWKRWLAPTVIVVMLGAAVFIFYNTFARGRKASPTPAPTAVATNPTPAAAAPTPATAAPNPAAPGKAVVPPGTTETDMGLGAEPYKMKVAQAVMVTVDLDFGGPPPSIAEAIHQIERGYQPDDGQGRTFAILDANGETGPDGKLHLSMHISSEKPGMGTLTFKRTGQLLWRARIGEPGDAAATKKNMLIYVDKGDGTDHVLDASRGGSTALDTYVRNTPYRLRDVWPEGSERQVTFIYSACGCPVKVMCRRVGERTVRTKDLPVIFPDDPAAVATIARLMKW